MKFRIGNKLLLLFLVVALVPLSGVSYLTYRDAEKNYRKEATASLAVIAESKANGIKSYLLERMKDITVLSHTPSLIDAMERFEAAFDREGLDSRRYQAVEKEWGPFLIQYKGATGYQDLFLISPEGDAVFSVEKGEDLGSNYLTGPYKNSELAEVFDRARTLLETEVSDFGYYPATNEPAAFLAAPIFKEGHFVGVVALQMSNQEVYQAVQDYSGLGETGETIVGSRIGNQVIFVAPTRQDPFSAFRRRLVIGSHELLPLQEAAQGKRGSGISIDYRGKKVLAVWDYLPSFRWGIVVKIDSAEVFKPIAAMRNRFVVIMTLTTLMVILLSLFTAKSIAKPIRTLQEGTEIIAQGDLTKQIPVTTKDELGLLTDAFNKMTLNLKRSMQDLERRRKESEEREKQLKETQAMLVQAGKLTAMGQLGAGIAHELNQPLTAIQGLSQTMFGRMKSTDPYRQPLEKVIEQAKRMTKIIENIRKFGREAKGEVEPVDIHQTLEDALMLVSAQLKHHGIEVIKEYADSLPSVQGNANQLQQVFTNLLTNACDALDEVGLGGRIWMITQCRGAEARSVEVVFKNDGPSIPEKDITEIFNPFFTTKPPGKGTGLGLSISYGIIRDHHGSIEVENLKEGGVEFRISLPLSENTENTASPTDPIFAKIL